MTFSSSAHCSLGRVALQTNLQQDIASFCDWSSRNRMVLNTTKTKSMRVTGKRLKSQIYGSGLDLQAGGLAIEQVMHQKLLGVQLTKNLPSKNILINFVRKLALKLAF